MKFLKLFFAALLFVSSLSFVNVDQTSAATNISIYLNGTKQTYSNKAIIKNGTTLVPLRGIFESLGATVNWNQTTKTIDAKRGDTTIWLKIGSTTTKVNGKNVSIAVPAQVVSGSTLVPLRFISEALGATVDWNQTTKTIKITSKVVSTNKMKVHFINVGQGDSTFIQLASGQNILIDAGTDQAGETVVSYLKSLGVTRLDYVIATHPDADHIGGIEDVLNAFKVDKFIDSGKVHTSKTYESMLLAVQQEGSQFIVPNTGQYLINDQTLQSYLKIINANPNASETNDASLVVEAGYCSQDVLLMADASTTIENNLLLTNKVSQAEILKAGHHGSSTSSSLSFLKTVKPQTVILSYAKDNSYGHPHQTVLSNIESIGATMYATAQDGTIVATADCNGYSVNGKQYNVQQVITPTPTSTTTKPTGDVNSGTYVVPGAPTSFNNCTELRTVYPNGVKKGHVAYASKHDRDNDGWACEK
jgi:competence protein ComEC